MAQGKGKLSKKGNKLPAGATKKIAKKKKGNAVTRRPNAPVKSKVATVNKSKMKANVTKMVNAAAEKQLRSLSKHTPTLSAAQQRAAAAPTAPAVSKK
ncbi:Uncharacterized protein OBRU01_04509 [Operophtera brumata]|uniref:Uncharacterized protein n=1 Tax=Operophtera brumata TaxID=104452 RepID=A0A0L7LPT7_OPEBR|nr:Uncharacterized protein OBRU01_04509 [Operophtera brumata]